MFQEGVRTHQAWHYYRCDVKSANLSFTFSRTTFDHFFNCGVELLE